jgi:hypothetical protein
MEDLFTKAAIIAAAAVATFSSFPSTAQQQPAAQAQHQTVPAAPNSGQPTQSEPTQTPGATQSPSATASQSPGATETNPSTNRSTEYASAPALRLEPVKAELQGKLDSTSTKTGDSVVVKTKEDVKTPDGAEIPKGSKLVGKVTIAQGRGEGKENSQIAIQFDHAELQSGQSLPIQSVIQSVAPAGDNGSQKSTGEYASPTGSGSAMKNAPSAPNSAGVNSGTTNSGMNGNSARGQPGTSANAPQAPNPANAGTAGENSGAPAPGTIVARSGNVAIRMTAIPGVLLANNINGQPFSNASGMLLGARRDIHLDGGTEMVVAVASAPGNTSGGPTSPNNR